ncbi:MAG: phage holin family protein [Verrucomicrobiae bacterium]|nr:phage holin family protein [Verrucomicrobiae bacterium]
MNNIDQLCVLLSNPKNLVFVGLFFLGMLLKATPKFPDWLIPHVVAAAGIALGLFLFGGLSGAVLGFIFGCAIVWGHQAVNQPFNAITQPQQKDTK